jgi:hypothetical protein
MFIYNLGAPAAGCTSSSFKGGQAIGEDDARKLLTILAGPSAYQRYLKKAMEQQATTVPKRFLRIVTSMSQVPNHLRGVFEKNVGGTLDRWTRTIYMVPAPGLRFETRLQYALHECVHLFAHPHVPVRGHCPQLCVGTFQRRFGRGFGEGLTQIITEDIMDAQCISRYYRDPHPYQDFTDPMRKIVSIFGLATMARAYFFGEVQPLMTAMDVRWGTASNEVGDAISAGDPNSAHARIRRLEAEYEERLKQMIRQAPKGDFPAPTKYRHTA